MTFTLSQNGKETHSVNTAKYKTETGTLNIIIMAVHVSEQRVCRWSRDGVQTPQLYKPYCHKISYIQIYKI